MGREWRELNWKDFFNSSVSKVVSGCGRFSPPGGMVFSFVFCLVGSLSCLMFSFLVSLYVIPVDKNSTYCDNISDCERSVISVQCNCRSNHVCYQVQVGGILVEQKGAFA